jgi:hypothetical protein
MAQNLPLHIDAGATFTRQFNFGKADGTAWASDYNCRVVVRDMNDNKVLDVVPTFDRATGDITLTLTAAQTSSLTDPRYRWGLELAGTSETLRLLQGRASVSSEVVR